MNKAIFAVMMFLVSAAIIGGFMVVGGPGQARLERQDRERLTELRRLHDFLACVPQGAAQKPLPQTLDDPDYCARSVVLWPDGPARLDGAAVEYRRLSDSAFEICAQFATDLEASRDLSYLAHRIVAHEGNVGCLSGDNGYRS